MKNKLPRVFVNKIDKPIRHSQRETLVGEEMVSYVNLDDVLNNKNTYSFNHKYRISLKNNMVVESSIILKDNNMILTIDGDKININDIKNIVEIKK